jgi:hypothetical protein
MTFYLFGALARRGALSQLLTEVALGSVGYDDGANIWHFILIVPFIMRDATIRAHFVRISTLTFKIECRMTFYLLFQSSSSSDLYHPRLGCLLQINCIAQQWAFFACRPFSPKANTT